MKEVRSKYGGRHTSSIGSKGEVSGIWKTMSSLFLMVIIMLCSQQTIYAQSLGYDNHRIACSADGNNQPDDKHLWPKGDWDDWAAGTPAALSIIAKLKLQGKLVHYSYNNFIDAPPHTTEPNLMKIGVDGAIDYWKFSPSVFFDVSADDTAAINHLASEIEKSTESDPLYFLHMGPAEFFYRAVEKAIDDGGITALSYVYVISHSGYNDNHLRRGDPDFDLEPVPESEKHHTMAEAVTLSGDRINYTKIKDQNGSADPNALWASGTDWSVWDWMRTHSDPSINWLYDRMKDSPKDEGDISDAGMLYYLFAGDDDGSPSKFEVFIGAGIDVDLVPIGQTVAFKANANSKYLCSDKALDSVYWPLVANRSTVGSWEKFDVIDAGNGMIALKALGNDKYVSANKWLDSVNIPLVANATTIGDWEKFTWIFNSDGTVTLKANSSNQYVCVDKYTDTENPPAVANRSTVGSWEKFTIEIK